MESIVMFDIKELAKEVGFRKMLREISAYEDLDEKVEAELAKIELMEEDSNFLLEEWEEVPEELKIFRHSFTKRAATAALFVIGKKIKQHRNPEKSRDFGREIMIHSDFPAAEHNFSVGKGNFLRSSSTLSLKERIISENYHAVSTIAFLPKFLNR